jgi:glycosyltransferase involved in cell wall biosynthesis
VIDLAEFDRQARQAAGFPETPARLRVALVARQVGFKRIDRFLRVLALARRQEPAIQGVLAGDGPERPALEAQAAALGLLAYDGSVPGVVFLGERHDVPALLAASDMLLLTSDEEGFPNVILEAMAACLPVITTGAGAAAVAVEDGLTGYVVPFDSEESLVEGLTGRLLLLARQPALRARFGRAGRQRVEQLYGLDGLAARLLDIYRQFAGLRNDRRLERLLEVWSA